MGSRMHTDQRREIRQEDRTCSLPGCRCCEARVPGAPPSLLRTRNPLPPPAEAKHPSQRRQGAVRRVVTGRRSSSTEGPRTSAISEASSGSGMSAGSTMEPAVAKPAEDANSAASMSLPPSRSFSGPLMEGKRPGQSCQPRSQAITQDTSNNPNKAPSDWSDNRQLQSQSSYALSSSSSCHR